MDCVVASVWQKKKACVSGEKFERTLAHDFEADFFYCSLYPSIQ